MSDTNGTVRPPLGIRLLHALRKEPDCSSKYPVLFRLVRVSGGAAELPLPARSNLRMEQICSRGAEHRWSTEVRLAASGLR
jgi:hypothetical protein